MLILYLRSGLVSPTISIAIGLMSLLIGGTAGSQEIDCDVATTIAGRAYKRAAEAILAKDYRVAMASKQAFWDIEEHSPECETIRKLAKALTDKGLGRAAVYQIDLARPTSGSSGGVASTVSGDASTGGASAAGQGTGHAMTPNSTVIAIEVMPAWSDLGAGSVAGSSGASGVSSERAEERASDERATYVITLQMDDGSTRRVMQEVMPDFRSGDRVNITDGVIYREAAPGTHQGVPRRR